MIWMNALLSALANLTILCGLPFLGYGLYHRLRHRRPWGESARRAGLQLGKLRYLGYAAGIALLVAGALAVWPPPLEPLLSKGSAMASFEGLAFAPALGLSLLYGVVKTGFAEEFLFRGLIAGSLGRRLPLWSANLVQAAIFLLPHLFLLIVMERIWGILVLVFLGALVSGWLRIRSGSILAPWMLHATANVATALSVALRT